MAKKQKFILEYEVNCSPAILYDFFASPEGFREWFADKVVQKDNIFIFSWSGNGETNVEDAEQLETEINKRTKYRWLKNKSSEDEFFEFNIYKTEISNQTIFSITDFAPINEINDQKKLWEHQIKELFHRIGLVS